MLASYWPEDHRLFSSAAYDAMRAALETTRTFRELEASVLSGSTYALLEQQRAAERSARELRAYDTVALALANVPDISTPSERLTALRYPSESHAELLEAASLREQLFSWTEMQERIETLVNTNPIVRWDEIRRSAVASGFANPVAEQLARVADFDGVLKAAIPDPAHAVWARHLKMTALPTLSFLAQEWSTAIALLTSAGREIGASVSWLARDRGEPRLMTSALTPRAESRRPDLELLLGEDILCALCGGPMVTIGQSISWIGPYRGVRRRRIFPACPQCMTRESEEPGFLYEALCSLTSPSLVVRGVIRGGGQGDGRPQGRLRLVRMEDADDRQT